MEDKYKKLFGYINIIEPPRNLKGKIVAKINLEQRRVNRFWFLVSGFSTAISLGMIVPLVSYINNSFSQSGFYQYFSLLFSGDSTVYTYWKEVGVVLIESAPIVGLIALLSAIALLVWSFSRTFKEARVFLLAA
jgi:hypothetical protein